MLFITSSSNFPTFLNCWCCNGILCFAFLRSLRKNGENFTCDFQEHDGYRHLLGVSYLYFWQIVNSLHIFSHSWNSSGNILHFYWILSLFFDKIWVLCFALQGLQELFNLPVQCGAFLLHFLDILSWFPDNSFIRKTNIFPQIKKCRNPNHFNKFHTIIFCIIFSQIELSDGSGGVLSLLGFWIKISGLLR